MLKQNKNRGAGLVTVVAVLAIASILLSGAIFLAFNHYRNVIQAEIAQQEIAELDLVADMICLQLGGANKFDSEMIFVEDGLISKFYNVSFAEQTADKEQIPASYIFSGITVTPHTQPDGDFLEMTYGDTKLYYQFSFENNVWTYSRTAVKPEVNDGKT